MAEKCFKKQKQKQKQKLKNKKEKEERRAACKVIVVRACGSHPPSGLRQAKPTPAVRFLIKKPTPAALPGFSF
ncbi:hypothetical protein ACJJIR_00415 [Microbulbifer sp. SSSA008]|uniref:hypothetical protein n=1 Tax=Microbulbifer sp. SSSA008 TaxID=3243380 RepID=UPI00403A5FAD